MGWRIFFLAHAFFVCPVGGVTRLGKFTLGLVLGTVSGGNILSEK